MKINKITQLIVNNVISEYNDGKSINEIKQLSKCSIYNIRKILISNNVKLRDKGYGRRKYKNINEKFFDIIDTQEKAYYLGLLFADGNISEKRNSIRISLSEIDKHIASSFSSEIYGTENIFFIDNKKYPYRCKNASNSYCVEINSSHMKNTLVTHGCVPNKSLKITFPHHIPDNLIRHFIRGYFDGDGCISSCANKCSNGTKDYMMTITSTELFCRAIADIIFNTLGMTVSVLKANVKNDITKTLHTGGNMKILTIMDWLYCDASVFLYRKRDKYLLLKKQCVKLGHITIIPA